MSEPPVHWTTHPMADFDMRYWRGLLRELDERYGQAKGEIWHAAEQYALFYAAERKIKLVNLIRREIAGWDTAEDSGARVAKDAVAWLDGLASGLDGHHADTVGKSDERVAALPVFWDAKEALWQIGHLDAQGRARSVPVRWEPGPGLAWPLACLADSGCPGEVRYS